MVGGESAAPGVRSVGFVRRRRKADCLVQPPARLVAFDLADWLPLVDPAGYDPEDYRNRGPDGPYGPPNWTFEAWRAQQAWNAWSHARLDWLERYGWPGGLDFVELLRETVTARLVECQPERKT